MYFTKYFSAGKDYVLIKDTNYALTTTDTKVLCDRIRGIGADGIITKENKFQNTYRITLFTERKKATDHSSAAVCAFCDTVSENDFSEYTFTNSENETLTIKRISKFPAMLYCRLHEEIPSEIFKNIGRKTEIGNRILTVTPIYILGCYAVHFSENTDRLDITYLGKKLSENSLFSKQASLILAEKTDKNSYKVSFYENKTGCPRPTIAALASTALSACKNGYSNYNENINISCNGFDVNVTCISSDDITVECRAEKIFTGKLG